MPERKKPAKGKRKPPRKQCELGGGTDVRVALIDGATFYAKPVKYTVVDGIAIMEGDIELGPVEKVERITEMHRMEQRGEVAFGVVITGADNHWTNCVIPYTIDDGLPNQNRVTDAIAHWEANTNYGFVERTAENAAEYPDWVTFTTRTANCSSSVGRVGGGQQFIRLASGCTVGNTIHEIGHTVGLWHEQSREDRDSHVTINWDKIEEGFAHNFDQHIDDGDDVGDYDYGSIMHYPRDAFSIDGSDTITPTDPDAEIGQRDGLSALDIAAANSLCTPVGGCPVAPFAVTCPPTPGVMMCIAGPNCPSAPLLQQRCPPAPFVLQCIAGPYILQCIAGPHYCAAAPRAVCAPAPIERLCHAGPYLRPEITARLPEVMPEIPYMPYTVMVPYGYPGTLPGYNPHMGGGFGAYNPYAYGFPQAFGYAPQSPCRCSETQAQDWTATEYADPSTTETARQPKQRTPLRTQQANKGWRRPYNPWIRR